MLTAPLFAPWRPLWDAVCPELTSSVDKVVEKRRRGRCSPPPYGIGPKDKALLNALELADGKLTSAAFLQQTLVPLLNACVWPRWLLLEAALDDSAYAGDLNLVSQILRTQIEELDTLRAAANLIACGDDSLLSEPALQKHIRTTRIHLLPRLSAKSDAELLAPAATDSADRPPQLAEAFNLLSEYSHPNYGSHMLAVRPHASEAASVICKTFLTIYEAFTALPWVQAESNNKHLAPAASGVRQLDPFSHLADITLSALQASLPAVPDHIWRTTADTFRTVSLAYAEPDHACELPPKEAIAALTEAGSPIDQWPESLRFRTTRSSYELLLQIEDDLIAAANNVSAPPTDDKSTDPAALLIPALGFAITLTEYKLQTLRRRAAVLINNSNVLGAAIAVRSMIEHHAVAAILSEKMDLIWTRLEKGGPVHAELKKAEKQVARVLAGSSRPSENATAWRTLWLELVGKPYNVMDPIKSFDKDEPGIEKTYGLLSHIVHGTICTGGDLLGPSGTIASQLPTLAQLTLFLAQMSTHSAMLDRQGSTMLLAHRLDMVKRRSNDLGQAIKEMALPAELKIKTGRDIRGEGTRESPFRFRKGLLYHEAFYRYLQQERIEMISRQLVAADQAIVDCVNTADGRAVYFLNDSFS